MRYKVLRNGETIIVTNNFKHVGEAYNKAIYYGKPGDIVKLQYRDSPDKPWTTMKKDWL